jgi:hypothetical protein
MVPVLSRRRQRRPPRSVELHPDDRRTNPPLASVMLCPHHEFDDHSLQILVLPGSISTIVRPTNSSRSPSRRFSAPSRSSRAPGRPHHRATDRVGNVPGSPGLRELAAPQRVGSSLGTPRGFELVATGRSRPPGPNVEAQPFAYQQVAEKSWRLHSLGMPLSAIARVLERLRQNDRQGSENGDANVVRRAANPLAIGPIDGECRSFSLPIGVR